MILKKKNLTSNYYSSNTVL